MLDRFLFSKLLKLEKPWRVDQVEFSAASGDVNVYLEHRPKSQFQCPECGSMFPVYDHAPSRSWRHLDHGEYITWLHARLPRVYCLEHGVRRARVPWALPDARFTVAFERHAIDVLLEADVQGASRLLRLTWDESWNVMERAVSRGQKAKERLIIERLGVDEKAVGKRHQYVTVVCDLDRGTVEYIADDRRKSSLDAYYRSLTKEQLEGIKGVAMDMWDPFITSTKEHVPAGNAKIVFDRYHIMNHMLKAVDQVRKHEHRLLMEADDDTLTGTKYLWLFSEENLPEKWKKRFEGLKTMHLQTARAWAIKEALRDLWNYQRKGWALRYWKSWYFWATHSQLPPVVKAAKTIASHLENVLTYFDHRITNATAEGLNSKIQTIKKTPMATVIASI